jgi:hypothetical protein
MPSLACPACGREIQFPEYFYGTRVNCPAAGCGRPVQLPNADGTMPAATGMLVEPLPVPAAEYFLRKPFEPNVDFTHGGELALVLVAGDGHIREVPWPAGCGDESVRNPVRSN